jgi:hypothetical protein
VSVEPLVVRALDDTGGIVYPVNALQVFLKGECLWSAVQSFQGMSVLCAIQAQSFNVVAVVCSHTDKHQSVINHFCKYLCKPSVDFNPAGVIAMLIG